MKKSILEVVHESAKNLHDAGLVDTITMREFDVLCLPKIRKFKPKEIQKMRLKEKVSQPVFAKLLNTSPSTVKHWETGEKHPSGVSLKLLNLVHDKGLMVLI